MKLQRTVHFNPLLFSVVPLINVLVLVLAYATLSQTFVLQPGLSVSLPLSPFALTANRNAVIVHITGGAIPTLYWIDRKVTLDELEQQLQEKKGDGASLIIRADRSVPFELISNVMNLALLQGYSVSIAGQSPQNGTPAR